MNIDKILKENMLVGHFSLLPAHHPCKPRELRVGKCFVRDRIENFVLGDIIKIDIEQSFWPQKYITVHGKAIMHYVAPSVGYTIPYTTKLKVEVNDTWVYLIWTQKIPLLEVFDHHNDVNTRLIHTTFQFTWAEKIYVKAVKLYRWITKWNRKRSKTEILYTSTTNLRNYSNYEN